MPTNESTNVGWVFKEQNVEHLAWIFRELARCEDSLDTQPTLVTNAGLNASVGDHQVFSHPGVPHIDQSELDMCAMHTLKH